jgi:hypothetical protein
MAGTLVLLIFASNENRFLACLPDAADAAEPEHRRAVNAVLLSAVAMLHSSPLASFFGPLQLIGYLACGVSFAAFFAGSHRRFLMVGATGAMIWALHYHLLGERVAAALSALSGGRNTIATRVHGLRRPLRIGLTVVFCALVATLGLYARSGPLVALPVFASCLSTTATFWLIGRAFRSAYLVSDSCWLLFGVLAGSTAGWIAAVISLCLNVWTMRREEVRRAAEPSAGA